MMFIYAPVSFNEKIQRIRENDPHIDALVMKDNYGCIQNMTKEEWEKFGRDIANNTHLSYVELSGGTLNDHRFSYLFQGLTRGISMTQLRLYENELSVAAIRSMVPFLQNANNLMHLAIDSNNIQAEGFNLMFRALCDSPIEVLDCRICGIESIEIDIEIKPKHLKQLFLSDNSINADGCRELAKLLQGGDATLEDLSLLHNKIDDDGVELLVDALRSNTSLRKLCLSGNDGISRHGQTVLLKLVNDISSIEATLQSNHTLRHLSFCMKADQVNRHIKLATQINMENGSNPEAAGREKVIRTQLHSETRAKLAEIQGVTHSLYSEINPLHLPEVLAMVGRHHDQGELYIALKASIAGVISTVNRKQCILVQMAYYASKLEQLGAELAAIDEAAQGGSAEDGESRSSKRRRKWWWW